MLPRNPPQPVLDALNAECKVFLDREDTRTRIREIGSVPDHGTPAQHAAFIQAEIEKFAAIIAKEKLQMDIN
jgi:tripartite-type tricarboxylate transporter receptor subunit TctC